MRRSDRVIWNFLDITSDIVSRKLGLTRDITHIQWHMDALAELSYRENPKQMFSSLLLFMSDAGMSLFFIFLIFIVSYSPNLYYRSPCFFCCLLLFVFNYWLKCVQLFFRKSVLSTLLLCLVVCWMTANATRNLINNFN